MDKFLTYLACPYSHADPKVRSERYEAANLATVALIRCYKWNVFSPITHSHPLHELGLDGDWKFWERIDTEYLNVSRRLVVLCIPGWDRSTGVRAEINIAKKLGIDIFFMSLPTTTASNSQNAFTRTISETSFRFSHWPEDVVDDAGAKYWRYLHV